MNESKVKKEKRDRRHARVRATVKGSKERPRLSVFKSNKFVHVQLINDETGSTIVGLVSKDIKAKTSMERSREAGKMIAQEAVKKGVKDVVFDRGGFSFRGHVKEVAEGAREGGLNF